MKHLQSVAGEKRAPERDVYVVKQLKSFFTDRELGTLMRSVVRTYMDKRKADSMAPATINREIGLFSAAINYARREWDWDIEGGNTKNGKRPSIPLNREAREALLDLARYRAENYPDSPWVFAPPNGERLESVVTAYKMLLKRVKNSLNGVNNMATTENHNPAKNYYRHVRSEIAEHVVCGKHRVLDVGCAAGVLGEYLKQQGCASEVVGIEIDALAAKEAAAKLDRVLCANLNHAGVIDVLNDFDKASFDYIICADVLEHLIDPWTILADLATFIKPGGRLVVSLPNVQHWSIWVPLILSGRWEYCEAGIMDRTHLRFFTRSSSQKLIIGANLKVIECQPMLYRKSERILNSITFGLLEGWLASQWVLVGKSGGGQPDGKK